MQTIKRWVIALILISGAILLALYFGGIIFKKNPAEMHKQLKTEMASLMMLDHNDAFKRLKKQWSAVALTGEEKMERVAKINRLMALNGKVISSYKRELHNLSKLGAEQKGPEIAFIREQLHQSNLDGIMLKRELDRMKAGMTEQERQMIAALIKVDQECVSCCAQEMEAYKTMGLQENDPRLKDANLRMEQALAEIKQLGSILE